MIVGIGIDLVDVRRVESMIFRWQERFLKRVFTSKEIRYCNNKRNPATRFATRYAAKEAFIKAIYPKGFEDIDLLNIEIDQKSGRPFVNATGGVKERLEKMNVKNVFVMLSHDGDYGIANVVLEG
ncbi:holo-ACP synthase [bacterium]|nr:holo-ACP synthase [bacterium]